MQVLKQLTTYERKTDVKTFKNENNLPQHWLHMKLQRAVTIKLRESSLCRWNVISWLIFRRIYRELFLSHGGLYSILENVENYFKMVYNVYMFIRTEKNQYFISILL